MQCKRMPRKRRYAGAQMLIYLWVKVNTASDNEMRSH
jgi:hypothetical protein